MNLKFRKGKPCFAHQLQIIQIVLKSFRMFQTSPNEVRILCFYCRLQNREHWLLFATNYLFLAAEINVIAIRLGVLLCFLPTKTYVMAHWHMK